MSIQKEKNGTYTVRYRIKDSVTGKKKQSQARGFKTKTEAKRFEDGLNSPSTDMLFYDLFIEYQNTLDQNGETFQDKVGLIDRYIPAFKIIKYNELTKPYLSKIRAEIAQLDLSPVRKNKILSLIKTTCRYAYEVYDLKDYSKVIKSFKVEHKKMDIWSLEEYQKFEECCDDKYKPFFRLIFFTGLRKGEAKALKVEDLDINNATVSVRKAMRKGVSSYGNTKNPQSVRKVQIDAVTLEMLKPLKENETWLFGDYKPLANTTIERHYKETIKKAKIKYVRIHDLRHSHCSILIGNGIDAVSVSKRVGHSDASTTLKVYAHALENSDNKIVNFLNGVQNVSS